MRWKPYHYGPIKPIKTWNPAVWGCSSKVYLYSFLVRFQRNYIIYNKHSSNVNAGTVFTRKSTAHVSIWPRKLAYSLTLKAHKSLPIISFHLISYNSLIRNWVYRVLARLLFVTNWDKLVIPCTVIVKGDGLNRLLFHLIWRLPVP